MAYYSYEAGYCDYSGCHTYIGFTETNGGRQRQYCSDTCRQRAHRERHKAEKRAALLQYNTELRDYWRENNIDGQVLTMLQDILVEHGKAAARAATDAVLTALKLAQEDQNRVAKLRAFGM